MQKKRFNQLFDFIAFHAVLDENLLLSTSYCGKVIRNITLSIKEHRNAKHSSNVNWKRISFNKINFLSLVFFSKRYSLHRRATFWYISWMCRHVSRCTVIRWIISLCLIIYAFKNLDDLLAIRLLCDWDTDLSVSTIFSFK